MGESGFTILTSRSGNLPRDGKNLYVYVQNDSIDDIDPFGLSRWSCFKNTLAALGEPVTSLELTLFIACIGGCAAVTEGVGVVPGVLGCLTVVFGGSAVGIWLGCSGQ